VRSSARPLAQAVCRLPAPPALDAAAPELFADAERHGLDGVLFEACRAAGVPLPAALERTLALRAAARACDHAAHLAMLERIDGVLAAAGRRGVVLKGALLGARLYATPSSRPTSDIDLLVEEADVDDVAAALSAVGYASSRDPSEEHFRRRGHHLHLLHPEAPCLELHFHAYRGFGGVLRSEPLLARSVRAAPSPSRAPAFSALRVLEPADELFYLAVHAAGHRFVRLGWLYDLLLLARRLSPSDFAVAAERARDVRMSRPFALALERLRALGHAAPPTDDALGLRRRLLAAVTDEPASPLARSATRFAYTMALCQDVAAARSYARDAIQFRLEQRASRHPRSL
jgi:hypothetical protein